MSLRDDFGMYYSNSYVGMVINGKTLPFFVHHVETGEGFEPDDYSEAATAALVFVGHMLKEDGDFVNKQGSVAEGTIDLEMQELGYIKDRAGNLVWTAWRPQRSTKKGLCHRRIDGIRGEITRSMAAAIFKMWKETNVIERQFGVDGEELLYKGRSIGTKVGNTFTVRPQYRYLRGTILKGFGNDVVFEVMPEEENA